MNTPPLMPSINPRHPADVAAAALAVQANVVSLRVAWSRAAGQPPESHDIRTPAPGAVRRFREMLIDRAILKDYSLEELTLRLRQVWGEFAAFCWMFDDPDPHRPTDFATAHDRLAMKCPMHVQAKIEEVQFALWRMRHENQARNDPSARENPEFRASHEFALAHPVKVYTQDVRLCSDEDLLACACEYAGTLAALRWVLDNRLAWEQLGIMEVTRPNQK